MNILVVDDHVDTAECLGLLLKMHGHRVRTFEDGQAALQAARSSQPDALLTDIGMPGMDGWQLAKQLRGLCRNKPFLIAITAYGDAAARKRSEEDGFDYHLVKPVDPTYLLELLEQLQVERRHKSTFESDCAAGGYPN
jgi:CheY-like chemotaxis protein